MTSVTFSPDGKRMVSGSRPDGAAVGRRDGPGDARPQGPHGPGPSVAFSPDGKRLVSAWLTRQLDSGTRRRARDPHPQGPHKRFVSPFRSARTASASSRGVGTRRLRLWDADTGTEKLALKGHTGLVNSVAFSPDGKRIVTGGGNPFNPFKPGEVKVWDAETGTEKLALKGHTDSVTSVAFSPDGKRIVSGSGDGTARVWGADTGTEKLALKGHTLPVTSVAFSPDGKRIVSGSGDLLNPERPAK